MAGLMDVFLMKERVNEGANPIFIILEKASILIALPIVVVLAVALELPAWAVGIVVGMSLGPIVYVPSYFLYILPPGPKN